MTQVGSAVASAAARSRSKEPLSPRSPALCAAGTEAAWVAGGAVAGSAGTTGACVAATPAACVAGGALAGGAEPTCACVAATGAACVAGGALAGGAGTTCAFVAANGAACVAGGATADVAGRPLPRPGRSMRWPRPRALVRRYEGGRGAACGAVVCGAVGGAFVAGAAVGGAAVGGAVGGPAVVVVAVVGRPDLIAWIWTTMPLMRATSSGVGRLESSAMTEAAAESKTFSSAAVRFASAAADPSETASAAKAVASSICPFSMRRMNSACCCSLMRAAVAGAAVAGAAVARAAVARAAVAGAAVAGVAVAGAALAAGVAVAEDDEVAAAAAVFASARWRGGVEVGDGRGRAAVPE